MDRKEPSAPSGLRMWATLRSSIGGDELGRYPAIDITWAAVLVALLPFQLRIRLPVARGRRPFAQLRQVPHGSRGYGSHP